MKYNITAISDYNRSSRKTFSLRQPCTARVFVESNATSLIDEWFNEKKIYNLNFKCKTWKKLGRRAHKINRQIISAALDVDPTDIVYSRYCGCSMCPCSPGYNVKSHKYGGKGIWIDITASQDDLDYINNFIPIANLELEVEIAEHNNK